MILEADESISEKPEPSGIGVVHLGIIVITKFGKF
jgi:hypothetical protein